jgi:hypothetical protein
MRRGDTNCHAPGWEVCHHAPTVSLRNLFDACAAESDLKIDWQNSLNYWPNIFYIPGTHPVSTFGMHRKHLTFMRQHFSGSGRWSPKMAAVILSSAACVRRSLCVSHSPPWVWVGFDWENVASELVLALDPALSRTGTASGLVSWRKSKNPVQKEGESAFGYSSHPSWGTRPMSNAILLLQLQPSPKMAEWPQPTLCCLAMAAHSDCFRSGHTTRTHPVSASVLPRGRKLPSPTGISFGEHIAKLELLGLQEEEG